VAFLSTIYEGPEAIIQVRRQPHSTQPYSHAIKRKFGFQSVIQLSLPSIAAHYDDRMNAVDISDQLRSHMHHDHRQLWGPARVLTWSFLLQRALKIASFVEKRAAKWDALEVIEPLATSYCERHLPTSYGIRRLVDDGFFSMGKNRTHLKTRMCQQLNLRQPTIN
jgi:hypothetical protein